MITNFTETVKQELIASVPGYTLALDHISQYYDMELAIFGIDRTKSLVVAFPILIKPIKAKHLTLYEIETVPVPITDTDTAAGIYSEVQISKPYIATTGNHYIQLRIQELCMCKTSSMNISVKKCSCCNIHQSTHVKALYITTIVQTLFQITVTLNFTKQICTS